MVFYGILWHKRMPSDDGLACIYVWMCPSPRRHYLTIIWQRQQFQDKKKLAKMPFLRYFTAFYGIKVCWMMTSWPAYMYECVLVPERHCLNIVWQKQRFQTKKTGKNAILTVFYGILRHKSMLNDDGLACIYGWMCLSARTSLFDRNMTKATVLDKKNWQKCHFYGILWHFMA